MKIRLDLWNDREGRCNSVIVPVYALYSIDLDLKGYDHLRVTLPEACYGCEEPCLNCSELGDE